MPEKNEDNQLDDLSDSTAKSETKEFKCSLCGAVLVQSEGSSSLFCPEGCQT